MGGSEVNWAIAHQQLDGNKSNVSMVGSACESLIPSQSMATVHNGANNNGSMLTQQTIRHQKINSLTSDKKSNLTNYIQSTA